MVICDIALYKVLLVNSENHDLKEALELSNLKNELELEYYNKMKVSIAETRKMNHDISNMITVVKAMVNDNNDNNSERANAIIQDLPKLLRTTKSENSVTMN